jgi:hypothetical protein
LVECFPLNILMVHLPKPTIIIAGSNLFSIELACGETIRFGSLEFIADCFDNLSISPEGIDLGTIFMGMAHSGSQSLHAILKESTGEDDSTSSEVESFDFPISQDCKVVI